MKLLLLRIFSFEGRGELMARGIDFWKPRLGEYTAPSSLCLCQYPYDKESANVVMWKDKEYEYIFSA